MAELPPRYLPVESNTLNDAPAMPRLEPASVMVAAMDPPRTSAKSIPDVVAPTLTFTVVPPAMPQPRHVTPG